MLFLLLPPFLVVALAGVAVHHASTTTEPTTRWWRVAHTGAPLVMASLFGLGAIDLANDAAVLT
jgi:hypothetical protein